MLTEHYTTTHHLVEDAFPRGSEVYVTVIEQDPPTVNTVKGVVSLDGYSATLEDGRFVYLPEGMAFLEERLADQLTVELRERLVKNQS